MAVEARRTAVLRNESGLHARPAVAFVAAASGYDSAVTVNGADARSILSILALGAGKGAELEIVAIGADAEAAVAGLAALVESGLGEGGAEESAKPGEAASDMGESASASGESGE